jgi:hypothetical protein
VLKEIHPWEVVIELKCEMSLASFADPESNIKQVAKLTIYRLCLNSKSGGKLMAPKEVRQAINVTIPHCVVRIKCSSYM